MFWTPRHLAAVLQGRWLHPPDDLDAPLAGLSTDTRTLEPGQVFLALRGERFDGHDHLAAAFDRGAPMAIASRPSALADPPVGVLLVPDTLAALQRLAAACRDHLAAGRCRVIAIGGSNGKTTTRHLIHHVLSRAGRTGTQSPKSFNNHIGVPLTLLAARPEHDFVAVEIGTNHPGEIDALAAIVRPDLAVITSIGEEHLEHFGDLAAVAREEASLLRHVRDGGAAFIGIEGWPDEFEYPLPLGVDLVLFDADDPPAASVALPGLHNRSNAAAAAAVARRLGVDDGTIAAALADVEPVEGRSQVLTLPDGTTILNDSYNANPTSMRAALDLLAGYAPARRVAILGDMLELGDASAAAHRAIAQHARACADVVVLVGERFGGPAWSDALVEVVRPGDVVLVKASRGMKLERAVAALRRRRA